jgi:Zn-finger nucleic acid-binding protein
LAFELGQLIHSRLQGNPKGWKMKYRTQNTDAEDAKVTQKEYQKEKMQKQREIVSF